MPRPGSPQQPRFQRGSELGYGQATAANDMVDMAEVPSEDPQMPMVTEEQFVPQNPEDMFLFSGTDKPDEPITAGAPFGPGPMGRPYETSGQFIQRVSGVLARTSNVPPEVKAFLDRAAAGE